MKRCSKCGIEKDEKEFSKHKAEKDGLRCYCKKCDKLYRENNKEKIKQHLVETKEKRALSLKIYYEVNKEEILAKGREYHSKNKEKRNAQSRENHSKNKEKRNARRNDYYYNNKEQALRKGKERRLANIEKYRERERMRNIDSKKRKVYFSIYREKNIERIKARQRANGKKIRFLQEKRKTERLAQQTAELKARRDALNRRVAARKVAFAIESPDEYSSNKAAIDRRIRAREVERFNRFEACRLNVDLCNTTISANDQELETLSHEVILNYARIEELLNETAEIRLILDEVFKER